MSYDSDWLLLLLHWFRRCEGKLHQYVQPLLVLMMHQEPTLLHCQQAAWYTVADRRVPWLQCVLICKWQQVSTAS